MSLLFFDGCGEYYDTSAIASVWTSARGTPVVNATGGRGGGAAIELGPADSLIQGFPSNPTVFLGMRFKVQSISVVDINFLSFFSGSTAHVRIYTTGAGEILVKRGTLTELGRTVGGIVTPGTFDYWEFGVTISDTVGVVTIRKNGSTVLALTNQDTKETAGGVFVSGVIIDGSSNHVTLTVDDLYVCDNNGSAPLNTFLGDVRADVLLPNSAGTTTNLTPSAGSNYQNVDDNPPDGDTTYNESATPNDIDLYNFPSLPSIVGGSTVLGVGVKILAKKLDAGIVSVRAKARPVATNYNGTSKALGIDYVYQMEIWEQNPETASAWTDATINASEFGVEVV